MAARFESAAAAGQQHRQIVVVMAVAIANAAAVNDHGVIEQGAIAIGRGFHLLQESSELLHVVLINGGHFIHQRGVIPMMRQAMVAFGHADLAIRAVAAFAGQHESGNTRDVRLQRDGHEVEHELRVLGEFERNAFRLRHVRHDDIIVLSLLFADLHLTLHFAHGGEIFVELAAIGWSQVTLQAFRIVGDKIENALIQPRIAGASGGIGGIFFATKEPFKYRARIDFRGDWERWVNARKCCSHRRRRNQNRNCRPSVRLRSRVREKRGA